MLVGASPDLRQQIAENPALQPRPEAASQRHSPIAAVVLVSADVDGVAGLLTLRERQAFTLYAPESILQVLRDNRIFDVLHPDLVARIALAPNEPVACGRLSMTLLALPGKTPLYLEERDATAPEAAPAYAAMFRAGGRTVIVAPACADITEPVRARFAEADLLFIDGTLFSDDEMERAGVGSKTGARMGHVSMGGPAGSLARLRDVAGRRVYFHINNTNPALDSSSPERAEVEAAGFEIAHDGMEIRL